MVLAMLVSVSMSFDPSIMFIKPFPVLSTQLPYWSNGSSIIATTESGGNIVLPYNSSFYFDESGNMFSSPTFGIKSMYNLWSFVVFSIVTLVLATCATVAHLRTKQTDWVVRQLRISKIQTVLFGCLYFVTYVLATSLVMAVIFNWVGFPPFSSIIYQTNY
jgi:hypothetical protein